MRWKELWVDIPDYNYCVSNTGKVMNKKNKKILKQGCSNGYMHVTLHKDGIGKIFYVHRLVVINFLFAITKEWEVNHIDGNKKNNRKDNLQVVSPSYNIQHAFAIGLRKPTIGILHPNCRLKELDIINIRNMKGMFTNQEIANKYKISPSYVGDILAKRRWKHIK